MPRDIQKEVALTTPDINIQLPQAKPEYKSMLANIQEKAPAIAQASSNFYKSHSQMMSVTLDVTAITPIRSIKHSLAEIEKTKAALVFSISAKLCLIERIGVIAVTSSVTLIIWECDL